MYKTKIPVLPTLCRKLIASSAKSYIKTCSTSSKSNPLDPKSVDTKT